ncbi:MAG TPA: hypothetical protein VGD48_24595, partial [Kutzneria sp.]
MRKLFAGTALCVAVVVALPGATASAATPPPEVKVQNDAVPAHPPVDPPVTDQAKRDQLLGSGWQQSSDRLWTTTGDSTGLHVLVADKKSGYAWRTAATLIKPGFDTDSWIGNACVTANGQRAVVVYAPRTFTNKEELFDRGGFTAVVDLSTGTVTDVPLQTTLAYY